jgi:hypothetical protein
MELKKFTILPAAIALSLIMAPAAMAGEGKGQPDTHQSPPTPPTPPTPPNKVPTPTPPGGGGGGGGSSSSNDPTIACRIGNRIVYTANFRQCKQLKYSLGYGHGQIHGHGQSGGQVIVDGGYAQGNGYVTGGGYRYYQPRRVIRYVAMPSPAARKQMEKRARKAARRAAEAAAYGYGMDGSVGFGYGAESMNGYGYAQGGMVGYGNGVMVGGYGNNVVVNGSVYAGNQVVVRKMRKGKKMRRVYVQQPVYGYEYDGSEMTKGGGF